MNTIQSISCTVSRVFHPKAEDYTPGTRTFFILNTREAGKVVGALTFYPEPGTRLNLTGSYETWHGERNFRFTRVTQDVPQDPRALLDYAASLAKGVGPKTAEKIWDAYGEDWQKHLEEMSPSVCIALTRTLDALGANKAKLDLTMFCLKIGLSPANADRAWNAWGADAVATITNNPYLLTTLDGIGFKTCDDEKMREFFNIGEKDMRRAVAAVDYAVNTMMEESGNSVVPRDGLYSMLRDLRISGECGALALAKLVKECRIEFVGFEHLTTLRVVSTEGDLAEYIVDNTRIGRYDGDLWKGEYKLDESQDEAVRAAIGSIGMTVINGGAGAGKTTIIQTIARTLSERGEKFNLCAFAGKAAARLREATGLSASTIHSLLGWRGDGAGFSLKSLEGETVILDEASMVPSSLLYEIAKRSPKRLVLVGDQAQLQPVGIGSPFHDVIDHLPALVHTLTTCYRNREAVFSAAMKIRNGEAIPGHAKSARESFDIVAVSDAADAHGRIVQLVKDGAIDFAQDLVLAPRNGDGDGAAFCTVKSLNESIQAIVNPHANGEKFLPNDRVMCVKNFAEKDVWNGTTGWIKFVDTDGVPMFVSDEGRDMILSEKEKRESIVPAYCLTVHKSQGSQYRNVYIVALKRDMARLMDRAMLYTAVTRAKHACTIFCDGDVSRIVNSTSRRNTYLQMVMKGEI